MSRSRGRPRSSTALSDIRRAGAGRAGLGSPLVPPSQGRSRRDGRKAAPVFRGSRPRSSWQAGPVFRGSRPRGLENRPRCAVAVRIPGVSAGDSSAPPGRPATRPVTGLVLTTSGRGAAGGSSEGAVLPTADQAPEGAGSGPRGARSPAWGPGAAAAARPPADRRSLLVARRASRRVRASPSPSPWPPTAGPPQSWEPPSWERASWDSQSAGPADWLNPPGAARTGRNTVTCAARAPGGFDDLQAGELPPLPPGPMPGSGHPSGPLPPLPESDHRWGEPPPGRCPGGPPVTPGPGDEPSHGRAGARRGGPGPGGYPADPDGYPGNGPAFQTTGPATRKTGQATPTFRRLPA